MVTRRRSASLPGLGPRSSAGDPVALAAAFGHRLVACEWKVVTAESCTGGLIAAALTETAGSSAWFERGFVTYSNEAKRAELAVPAALLRAHGAVSEPVAGAMAAGALIASRAQVAIAVTGIAGPTGAVPGKPVGTVCFGWAARGSPPVTMTRRFAGDRRAVRLATVAWALRGAWALVDAVSRPVECGHAPGRGRRD